MKIALVTGATGAAGPAVVRALTAAGYRVRTFSRGASIAAVPQAEAVCGDVRDLEAVRRAAADVDTVVHMAAVLHETRPDARTLAAYQEVNVRGTEHVARAAVESGVRRFVHVSTTAVYGSGHDRPCNESMPPVPDSPYAESKLASEKAALAATDSHGAPLTVVVRPAAIYGPGLKGNYLRLVRALSRGRFVQIGPARNCRALIFDEDFANAVVAAATSGAQGHIYNVSDGHQHALRDIIAAIARGLDRRPPKWHVPAALALTAGGVIDGLSTVVGRGTNYGRDLEKYFESVLIDSSRLKRELGFSPSYALTDGWRITIHGLRNAHLIG